MYHVEHISSHLNGNCAVDFVIYRLIILTRSYHFLFFLYFETSSEVAVDQFSGICGVEFILPSAEQSLIQFMASNRFLSYSILLCPFSWVSQLSWVEPYFLHLQLYQVCRDGNPPTFAISTRCQTNAFSSGKEGTVSSTGSLTRDRKPMCNELFA